MSVITAAPRWVARAATLADLATGYTSAVAQLRALIADAYATTDDRRELPGLAHADALLDRLRPAPHWITVLDGGARDGHRFHCTADVGAPCREICEGAARGLCDDAHDVACDRTLLDGGECLAVLWLDEADPDALLAAYIGPEGREFTSAPVAVRWSALDTQWQWTYVADLPRDTSPQEWARARA
jgi:hypothetical protein